MNSSELKVTPHSSVEGDGSQRQSRLWPVGSSHDSQHHREVVVPGTGLCYMLSRDTETQILNFPYVFASFLIRGVRSENSSCANLGVRPFGGP